MASGRLLPSGIVLELGRLVFSSTQSLRIAFSCKGH